MRGILFEQFGEPAEVLRLREMPVPRPDPGEVRVRMLLSPVNPSDLLSIRGGYGNPPPLPASPGFEGVGVVEESGGGLFGKLLVGRRVAAMNRQGGNWSEQVVIPARQAIPLAGDLPPEQAAMFFVNPATAYVMTRHVLGLTRGDWLLQTAAGSALGRMIIRLGRHAGFRTVNVVRRQEQIAELKELGADEVFCFEADNDDPNQLAEQVFGVTGGGVCHAIDAVGGRTGSAILRCLAENARVLVYGTLSDEDLAFSPRWLIGPGAKLEGFWLSRWIQSQGIYSRLKLVGNITHLMRRQILVSDVGQVFPLEEIAQAVGEAQRQGRQGKVLLRITET